MQAGMRIIILDLGKPFVSFTIIFCLKFPLSIYLSYSTSKSTLVPTLLVKILLTILAYPIISQSSKFIVFNSPMPLILQLIHIT